MITGKSNCGKTFMLKPLRLIFECFEIPSHGTFNWVGAEQKECILLNDFRWSSKVIEWSDLLNVLEEGMVIHVPVPKTHFAEDALWTADTPFFATSKKKIVKYNEDGDIDQVETEMMDTRWKVWKFKYGHKVSAEKELAPCGKCFADLILGHRVMITI